MSDTVSKKMKAELLAPAGSVESLKTALYFGADAVYCGGPMLQLRAESSGFGMDALRSAASHVEQRAIATVRHTDANKDGVCDVCSADLGGGAQKQESNCVCGQYHTGPFAWLIKIIHKITYFFKNLFK